LRAACRRCNFGGGSRIAGANKRQTIARLEQIITEQQAQIDRLLETVGHYEDAERAKRQQPAIY
jgi:uncharacterized coiled-coil protein SlyX